MPEFWAKPNTPDAKHAHPIGITGNYRSVKRFIRYALRNVEPGQYLVHVANYDTATYDYVCPAYKRAATE